MRACRKARSGHKPNFACAFFENLSLAGHRVIYQPGRKIVKGPALRARAPYHALGRFSEKANQSMSIKLRIMSAMTQIAEEQHVDPFTIAEDAAFPLTVGDFVRAYENVPA
jgi:hypothetical protein